MAINKKIPCPICGRECRSEQGLINHKRLKHGINSVEPRSECGHDLSKYRVMTEAEKVQALRQFGRDYNLICTICGEVM